MEQFTPIKFEEEILLAFKMYKNMKKFTFALVATLLVVACNAGETIKSLPTPNKEPVS